VRKRLGQGGEQLGFGGGPGGAWATGGCWWGGGRGFDLGHRGNSRRLCGEPTGWYKAA
jgi:hypothetical protein